MSIKFYKPKDPYGCFSNFSKHPIQCDGILWTTSEHYFQAQKFAGTPHEVEVYSCVSPREAADMGRRRDFPLRNDWEEVKDGIMLKIVSAKIKAYPEIYDLLMSTGSEEIIEDSPIDYYWGCGADGSGKNMLGKIFMDIRNSYIRYGTCIDCQFMAEMASHPCVDGLALSNRIGYACTMFWDTDKGPIIPNWPPRSCGCEMFYRRDKKAV